MAVHEGTSSSHRLGLAPAPDGLCIVQELINTDAIEAFGVPDLLAESEVAQLWLVEALRVWTQQTGQLPCELALNHRDLPALRRLRAGLRHWLLTGDQAALSVPPKAMTVSVEAGRPLYRPHGDGAAGLTALIGMEMLLSTRAGTADRLRICMNSECAAAFYDLSKNGSRVWHDVKSCGNVANLRASRARRRVTPATGSATSK